MSEYRIAEKPAMEALAALVFQSLEPKATMAMRVEENGVTLKPLPVMALSELRRATRL